MPSIFMVTTTADAGPGSLRQAILDANAQPGTNTIAFDIGGGGVQTIQPLSVLPTITNHVVIDGTTQPGFAGTPVIVLNGSRTPDSDANGLLITAGYSTVQALVIDGFAGVGIGIQENGNNVIAGNYLGTDVTGTVAVGNRGGGVAIISSDNLIGGDRAGTGNLISGNGGGGLAQPGVYIANGTDNVVAGNYIGTDSTGTHALGNGDGITSLGDFTTIGGLNAGARNLISGNDASGVELLSTDNSVVMGNFIGTDVTGTHPLGNADAISFGGNVHNDTIGGTAAGAGNLISGNLGSGIDLDNGAYNILVAGNAIGTDAAGTGPLGNRLDGIHIESGGIDTIGGTVSGARNVISGNGRDGIGMSLTSQTQVLGNYIGTQADGLAALGNAQYGIWIDEASDVTIGGTSAGAGNVISGNTLDGLHIGIQGAVRTVVAGNYIGTDRTGTAPLGNDQDGISILAAVDTTIGGTTALARNLISGNARDGMNAFGVQDTVVGNYIGTDVTGTLAVGNGRDGINLGVALNSTFGGTAPGDGNVISGNTRNGLSVFGSGALVAGNFIGTNAAGNAALPNAADGVALETNAQDNIIGGTTPGAGNLIAANQGNGISANTNSRQNLILGNFIGADVTGETALGNAGSGIALHNSPNDVIGGTAAGAGNRIAFNGRDGVLVDGGTGDTILRNVIFGHDNGLGIELANGGNHDQEFPTVATATTDGDTTTIAGTLTSAPATAFTVEIFVNDECNPSGYGEGERFLASLTVTTDGDGNASFSLTVAVTVDPGQFITATATDPNGNTSAFSACVAVTGSHSRGKISQSAQAVAIGRTAADLAVPAGHEVLWATGSVNETPADQAGRPASSGIASLANHTSESDADWFFGSVSRELSALDEVGAAGTDAIFALPLDLI